MGVDECAISYWDRPAGRVLTLGYLPGQRRWTSSGRSYDIAGYPGDAPRARDAGDVDHRRRRPDGRSGRGRADARSTKHRMLVMLPLVAKGQSIGLVELISKAPVDVRRTSSCALARTMANEAAMALENARLYEDARKLADRDPLTGFYNHRYLHERLGEEVVRAQRSRRPLSVLMLDLDDFKLVNDTFGHLFGDRVLRLDRGADPFDPARVGRPGALRRRRVRDHPARDRRRRLRGAPPSGSSRRSRPRLRGRGPRPRADRAVDRRRDPSHATAGPAPS